MPKLEESGERRGCLWNFIRLAGDERKVRSIKSCYLDTQEKPECLKTSELVRTIAHRSVMRP